MKDDTPYQCLLRVLTNETSFSRSFVRFLVKLLGLHGRITISGKFIGTVRCMILKSDVEIRIRQSGYPRDGKTKREGTDDEVQ